MFDKSSKQHGVFSSGSSSETAPLIHKMYITENVYL